MQIVQPHTMHFARAIHLPPGMDVVGQKLKEMGYILLSYVSINWF